MQPFKPIKKKDYRPWYVKHPAFSLDGGKTWKGASFNRVKEDKDRREAEYAKRQAEREEREAEEKRKRQMRANPIPVEFSIEVQSTAIVLYRT